MQEFNDLQWGYPEDYFEYYSEDDYLCEPELVEYGKRPYPYQDVMKARTNVC